MPATNALGGNVSLYYTYIQYVSQKTGEETGSTYFHTVIDEEPSDSEAIVAIMEGQALRAFLASNLGSRVMKVESGPLENNHIEQLGCLKFATYGDM